jgi:hypothetical protein
MTSVTLDIDITNGGGDLLFFKPKTDPVTRRLIVDIGSKAVEKSKFILESHDKRDTIETIRHKIEEEYCGKFAIYKTRCEEKDKMIEMLEEQLASARNQNEMNSITLTQLSVGLENRMTKIDDTCSTLSSHLEVDKGKKSSADIGKEGEQELLAWLCKMYPTWDIFDAHAKGHQGDIHCISPGIEPVSILIDSKKFSTNVGKKDRDKFYADIVANPHFNGAILFSHTTGIATKTDLDMEVIDDTLIIYICNGVENLDKLRLAFSFIELFAKNTRDLDIKKLDIVGGILKDAVKNNKIIKRQIDELGKNIISLRDTHKKSMEYTKSLMSSIMK